VYQHLNSTVTERGREENVKEPGNGVRPLDSFLSTVSTPSVTSHAEMVYGSITNFSEEALVGRINADLANDLGT